MVLIFRNGRINICLLCSVYGKEAHFESSTRPWPPPQPRATSVIRFVASDNRQQSITCDVNKISNNNDDVLQHRIHPSIIMVFIIP